MPGTCLILFMDIPVLESLLYLLFHILECQSRSKNLRPEPYLPAHSSCPWWEKSEKSGYRPQLVHKLLYAIVFYADAKHHVSLCKVQFWWEVIHMLERVRDFAFFCPLKRWWVNTKTNCTCYQLPPTPARLTKMTDLNHYAQRGWKKSTVLLMGWTFHVAVRL